MLNLIRENVQSSFVKFIIGILALVFVFFGVGGFNSDSPNVLANIDGELVKLSDFQQKYRQEYDRFRQNYPGKLEKWQENYIKKQVFDNLLNQALIVKIAADKGFQVTDQELADWIFDNPSFQTDDRFDVNKYEEMLKRNRSSKVEFEKEIRSFLAYRKYVNFVLSNMPVNEKFLDEQFVAENQVYNVSVFDIPSADIEKDVQISDQEVLAYYNKNKNKFVEEKKLVIDYVKYTPDFFNKDVIVREKEITVYYDKNKEKQFSKPAQFKSRHILVKVDEGASKQKLEKAKKQADKIYKELVGNRSKFAALAKKYSDDPGSKENGGDLGWVSKGTFVTEFEEAIDSLDVDELSKPVKSQFGYHVIELKEKKEKRIQKIDEVKSLITQTIKANKTSRIIDAKLKKMEEELKEKGLSGFASSSERKSEKTDAFNGSSYLSDIPFSYELYKELKGKNLEDLGFFKSRGNQILAYQIKEIIPDGSKPLEEVKDQITLILKNDKKKIALKKELDAIAAKIKSEKDFNKYARKFKREAKIAKIKKSDQQILDYDSLPQTTKILFSSGKKGSVIVNVENDQNILIYLKSKTLAPDIDKEEELKQIRSTHQRLRMNLVFSSLIQKLRQEIEIDFNQDLLQSLEIPTA